MILLKSFCSFQILFSYDYNKSNFVDLEIVSTIFYTKFLFMETIAESYFQIMFFIVYILFYYYFPR